MGELDGARIEAQMDEEGVLRDGATGSTFDAVGRFSSGPLAGKRLTPAASVFTRWYGFAQTYPKASIWTP